MIGDPGPPPPRTDPGPPPPWTAPGAPPSRTADDGRRTVRRGARVQPAAAASPPQTPSDLDYDLPPEAIAQTPLAERDRARLLVDRGDRIDHLRVADLDTLVEPGDVMVVNDTRVFPARLQLRRATGGAVEVLLLEAPPVGGPSEEPGRRLDDPGWGRGWSGRQNRDDPGSADGSSDPARLSDDPGSGGGWWEALVKPSRRLRAGEVVASGSLEVEIGADLGGGRRLVRPAGLSGAGWSLDRLEEAAAVALPPYIGEPIADPERYQTVFARRPGSVAAPTAGLHLTEALLEKIRARGVTVAPLELAIGLDTFRPVTADRLDDHVMHRESYRVPEATAEAVASARRVVAVGTTAVRALETWAATGEASGRSSLFIRRPFHWRVVDALMTNFHLPRSTLLCLVDAFVGPRWRALYETALAEDYRFLSFGDTMLLSRTQ